jgi:hypothetical protein
MSSTLPTDLGTINISRHQGNGRGVRLKMTVDDGSFRSPEVDDVEGLATAATKHLEVLKERDEAEPSFIIEKIVGKLQRTENTRPFPLYLHPARFQGTQLVTISDRSNRNIQNAKCKLTKFHFN